MRPDLAKCTTESPRAGQGMVRAYKLKYGGTVRVHPDPEHDYLNEYGGFRPSGRHRQWDCKSFTDCLGALRGNIRANVGRPWNDVFSEFSKLLDRRSLSGFHIWSHLLQEVEINTHLYDGRVFYRSRYGGEREVDGYYVHPISGILEYQPYVSWRTRRRGQKTPIEKLEIPVPEEGGWKYCLIEGLWFRTKTVKRESNVGTPYYYSEYVLEKKSANRKEIAWIKKQLVELGY